jgi:hypothetical protein
VCISSLQVPAAQNPIAVALYQRYYRYCVINFRYQQPTHRQGYSWEQSDIHAAVSLSSCRNRYSHPRKKAERTQKKLPLSHLGSGNHSAYEVAASEGWGRRQMLLNKPNGFVMLALSLQSVTCDTNLTTLSRAVLTSAAVRVLQIAAVAVAEHPACQLRVNNNNQSL